MFILSVLISFAMICSCQKQDSTVEAQLAQRKTELDAREKVLDEKEKELALRETVLNEREQALAQREKAIARTGTTTSNVPSQGQIPDPALLRPSQGQSLDPEQLKAQREKMLQVLQPMIPDPSRVNAEMREQIAERKRRLEELQRTQPQMQTNAANQPSIPAATAAPAAVYPGADATSPSPSPTPQ